MAKLSLDLSKFKKITTNGKNTILAHPAGHRFIVQHKSLSPDQLEQLHALPFAEAVEKLTDKKTQETHKNPKLLSIDDGKAMQAMTSGMGMADGGPVQPQQPKPKDNDYQVGEQGSPGQKLTKTVQGWFGGMARGGKVDPTQRHLLPGDATPNAIEKKVVSQARAKMADGGELDRRIAENKKAESLAASATSPEGAQSALAASKGIPTDKATADSMGMPAYKEGGDVHADPTKAKKPEPKASPIPSQSNDIPMGIAPSLETEMMRPYADGGQVQDVDNSPEPVQDVDLNAIDPQTAQQAQATPEGAAPPAPAEQPKDPELLKKYQLYNQLKSSPSGRGLYHDPKDLFGPNGEPPASGALDAPTWDKAEALYSQDRASEAAKKQAADADLAANNAARQKAGLPPLPPNVAASQEQSEPGPALKAQDEAQNAANANIAAAGQPSPDMAGKKSGGMDDPYEMYKRGLGSAISATQTTGAVQSAQAQREDTILQQAQDSYKQIQDKYNAEWAQIDGTRKAIVDQIQGQKIDPNQYLKSLGVGGGIMNAIGLIVGGIGGGLTHQGNAALDFMNTQIDRNINAQKAELGKKENLLSACMRQFGNLQDATMMAKSITTDLVSHQIMQAGAVANTALAKTRAQQAAAELQMQGAQALPQMAMRRAMMGMMNGQGGQPRSIGEQINAMRWMNPEMAKNMEGRYLKVGNQEIMSTAVMPDKVKQDIASGMDAENKLAKLEAFAQQYGNVAGAISPTKVAEGKALAAEAQSAIRQAQDQGVYKESESKFMGNVIDPDPTKMLAKMRTLPGYKVARDANRSKILTLMNTYGAQVPTSMQRFQLKPPIVRKGP